MSNEGPPEPTDQDRENARKREAIAARQEAVYIECLLWSLEAFGPGWRPSCRHFLVEKEEEELSRRSGKKPKSAATVYTVRNDAGEARHFTVEGKTIIEHASYEAGFGAKLLEPHPTRRIEVRGQLVQPHRFALCWAGFELYHPKSAEQLAALRVSREQKKTEREAKQWIEENPLLAWAGRDGSEDDERHDETPR